MISSYFTRPGKMGNPAASALVQPAGSKTAPESASHEAPPSIGKPRKSSYSIQASVSTTMTWRSPSSTPPPSMGASGGMGYGPGSLSSGDSTNVTGTSGVAAVATVNGMPMGAPS